MVITSFVVERKMSSAGGVSNRIGGLVEVPVSTSQAVDAAAFERRAD
jgi:hypothetical protein